MQYNSSFFSSLSSFTGCPKYNFVPSGITDINANYSGQNCISRYDEKCYQCILAQSPEAVRCLQLFLLGKYFPVSTTFLVFNNKYVNNLIKRTHNHDYSIYTISNVINSML